MQLHNLVSFLKSKRPRVGRGGKRGTTSGRGQKGQGAHAGRRIRPAERDYIQRLPKLRGYNNKPTSKKFKVINLKDLEKYTTIPKGVKVLGGGEITRQLTITAARISKSAHEKIKRAGGAVKLNAKR